MISKTVGPAFSTILTLVECLLPINLLSRSIRVFLWAELGVYWINRTDSIGWISCLLFLGLDVAFVDFGLTLVYFCVNQWLFPSIFMALLFVAVM